MINTGYVIIVRTQDERSIGGRICGETASAHAFDNVSQTTFTAQNEQIDTVRTGQLKEEEYPYLYW